VGEKGGGASRNRTGGVLRTNGKGFSLGVLADVEQGGKASAMSKNARRRKKRECRPIKEPGENWRRKEVSWGEREAGRKGAVVPSRKESRGGNHGGKKAGKAREDSGKERRSYSWEMNMKSGVSPIVQRRSRGERLGDLYR